MGGRLLRHKQPPSGSVQRATPPVSNTGQPQPADKPLDQRDTKELKQKLAELVNESWVRGQVDEAMKCLNNPEQPSVLCITIKAPGSDREISIAPPDKDLTPQQLEGYLKIAREALEWGERAG